jgi:hypothetical protein
LERHLWGLPSAAILRHETPHSDAWLAAKFGPRSLPATTGEPAAATIRHERGIRMYRTAR